MFCTLKKNHPEKSDALSKTVFTGPNGSFPTDTKPEWSSVTPYLISHWYLRTSWPSLTQQFWTIKSNAFWQDFFMVYFKSTYLQKDDFLREPKSSTVMYILVWMKSYPRFWRNHTYCRNRWYIIWTGCFFHWDEANWDELKNKYIWIRLQTGVK